MTLAAVASTAAPARTPSVARRRASSSSRPSSTRCRDVRANLFGGLFDGDKKTTTKKASSGGSGGAKKKPAGKKTSSSSSSQKLEPFPKDYAQLIRQAQASLQAALDDGVELLEIQFPSGGLDTAPGDVEGNVENNLTVAHLRGICSQFERNGTAKTTRVFFPDPIERSLALTGAAPSPDGVRPPENSQTKPQFASFPGPIDYLEQPDFLSVSGLDKMLGTRKTVAMRVPESDTAFVVAYPCTNVSELVCTRELREGELARAGPARPIVMCNGELERTRSEYYPSFWNVGEMKPLRGFAREFEGVYFVHNYKGSNPAVLFRAYPGPWQVLRRRRDTDTYDIVYTCEEYPGLQKVALDILPKYP